MQRWVHRSLVVLRDCCFPELVGQGGEIDVSDQIIEVVRSIQAEGKA